MKTLFQSLDLGSPKFSAEDFSNMYHTYSGYNEEDYDKKLDYKYNFLLVLKDPKQLIMLNLDKRLKWKLGNPRHESLDEWPKKNNQSYTIFPFLGLLNCCN